MLGISLTGMETNAYFGIFVFMVLPVFSGSWFAAHSTRNVSASGVDGNAQARRKCRKWPLIDLNRTGHRNATIIFRGRYRLIHRDWRGRQLSGLSFHRVGDFLRHDLPQGYGTGAHGLSAITSRACGLRRVPCRLWRRLVCQVEAVRSLSGLRDAGQQVSATDSHADPQPATGARDLRAVSLAGESATALSSGNTSIIGMMKSSTPWAINMLVRVGGGNPILGHAAGIHWHMNVGVDIEYIARDERRQDIPWIRAVDKNTGRVTVYQNRREALYRRRDQ